MALFSLRHLGAAVVLSIAGHDPALAETPGHLLTEAAGIAAAMTEPGDRRIALAAVVETYAYRGDFAAAADLIASEPVTDHHPRLWAALIDGAVAGPGAETALTLLDEVPDPFDRDEALSRIGQSQAALGEVVAAAALLDQLPEGDDRSLLQVWIVEGWVRQGEVGRAIDALRAVADPDWRPGAALLLALGITQEPEAQEALVLLSSFGPGDGSPPRPQLAGAQARLLAILGREDGLRALHDGSEDPATRALILNHWALVLAEAGRAGEAAILLDSLPEENRHVLADWPAAAARIARVSGPEVAVDFLVAARLEGGAGLRIETAASQLADAGEAMLARQLLLASPKTERLSNGWVFVIAALAASDPDLAQADLARLSDPQSRFAAIQSILSHRHDAGLVDEALGIARAAELPRMRVVALTRLAEVL